MTPKAAYRVLNRLINEEWQSSGVLDYHNGKANMFRGFYGDYELKIKTSAGICTRKVQVSKHSNNKLKIKTDHA
jgi:hypothetical protein